MATGNVLLRTDVYVRINMNFSSLLLQAHRDSVRIVFSDLKPVLGNSAFHQLGGEDESLYIPFNDVNMWVLAVSDTSSLTVTEVNTSLESVTSSLNGRLYSLTGGVLVPQGEKLALNISLAASSVIKSASTVTGLPISLYNDHAIGDAATIYLANNMNQLSDDVSPSQGQLYESAVTQGDLLVHGQSEIEMDFISGYQKNSSVVVENTEPDQIVFISIIFEEFSDRVLVFGLTPTTLLTPTTEMSDYV